MRVLCISTQEYPPSVVLGNRAMVQENSHGLSKNVLNIPPDISMEVVGEYLTEAGLHCYGFGQYVNG